MEGKGLTVQVFPGLVLLVNYRKEHQPCALKQNTQRGLALLDDGVRCTNPQISLPVDHGLDRQFLFGKEGDLIVNAFFLCPLKRDHHRHGFSGKHVAKCNANLLLLGLNGTHAHSQCQTSNCATDSPARDRKGLQHETAPDYL